MSDDDDYEISGPRVGWGAGGPLTVGDTTGIVGFQKSFGDQRARVYTVSFQVNGSGFPEAEINCAVGDNPVQRRVTVANGMSLSLPASTVNVRVKDNAPAGEFTAGVKYGVSIICSPGTRGASIQPPFLVLRDANNAMVIVIPAGGGIDVPVPQDAGGVSLHFAGDAAIAGVNAIVPGSVKVDMRRGSTVLKTYDPIAFPGWIPLFPGTDNINLSNSNGFNINSGLMLGVDG